MATGAFKGGVVEITYLNGELKLSGTAETVQKACHDGKLIQDEVVKNLTQLAMSNGDHQDKAKGLKVKVLKDSGYLEIVHKKADNITRCRLAEQLFLAGWINLGLFADRIIIDRWGYKPR